MLFRGCIIFGLLLGGLCLRAQVFSDAYFRQLTHTGLQQAYNMEHEQAQATFEQLRAAYPANPVPEFMLALNRWVQSYPCKEMQTYHPYVVAHLQKALALNAAFAQKPAFDLEYTFVQSMTYCFLTRLYVVREEWVTSANMGRKAMPCLEKGFSLGAKATEFYFPSGVYHYYAEVYPQQHPMVKPIAAMFPAGDSKQGLKELELAAASENFSQPEALYYLVGIYLDANQPAKALTISRQLTQRYPNNTWFAMLHFEALCANKQWAEVERLATPFRTRFELLPNWGIRNIVSTESRYTTRTMFHVYHQLATAAFYTGKPTEEVQKLLRLSQLMADLAGVKEEATQAENHYYLGRCYDRLGKRPEAIAAYKRAIAAPRNETIRREAEAGVALPLR